MSRLIFILGGARSGKSTFAQQLAQRGGRSVAFIATATAGDEDMRHRIILHRAARPPHWHTIEEPLKLAAALRQAADTADVILLDCITVWLSNWLLSQGDPHHIESAWYFSFQYPAGHRLSYYRLTLPKVLYWRVPLEWYACNSAKT